MVEPDNPTFFSVDQVIPFDGQDSVNANPMQPTMAVPINSIFPTDYGLGLLFNLVEGMEEGVHATIDQDILSVTTEDMYPDLIGLPLDDQDITTLVPMATPDSPEIPDNRNSSPAPSTNSENTRFTVYSPVASSLSPAPQFSEVPSYSEESITPVVSPEDVFGEQLRPNKKKRGRKPKSETGTCAPPRAKKARKTKVYEIEHPFEDKEKERKRLNAVNAKRHRDLHRQNKETLEQQLEDVKNERDGFKKEIETLRENEVNLTQQLEVFKKHFGKQALSVVTLLQAGQVSFSKESSRWSEPLPKK